jgi:UPF0176 protein
MSHLVLLYYKFARLSNPEEERNLQEQWCRELGLRGRIIVAEEGINGTVSGSVDVAQEYMRRVHEHPQFAGTEFKVDEAEGHVFKRLSVKLRPEIVTLGIDADSVSNTGQRLSPVEFREKLDDPEAIVLDIRNDYEYEMGRFEGAVRPPVETFKEFPDWIEQQFGAQRDRLILTYCTGGIRCEKLTAYMREKGFQNVCQLHGGIVTYAKDPQVRGQKFEGDCFVFDDRLSVKVGDPVSRCEKCGELSARYVNCENVDCNRLYFLCEACENDKGLACSPACAESVRIRKPNDRLSPNLRSDGLRLKRRRHRAHRREAAQTAK